MAGVLVPLVPKRNYDFGSLIVGQAQTLILSEEIDISQHVDGILITRVHSSSAAGGTINLQLVADGYTRRDPTVQFHADPSGYFNLATGIDVTTTAGSVLANSGPAGSFIGEFAALVMSVNRTSAAPLTATISVDLLMRTPDDVDSVVQQAVADAGGCCCD